MRIKKVLRRDEIMKFITCYGRCEVVVERPE